MYWNYASETVDLRVRIDEELYRHISRAAAERGHCVADEIVRRLQGSREQDARVQALSTIRSTVQAADSTIVAIRELLTLVRPDEPSSFDPAPSKKKCPAA